MAVVSAESVTRLLIEVKGNAPGARDRLVEAVYAEIHRHAGRLMRGERVDHTLQPTALVNEALGALLGSDQLGDFENRRHFFGAVALAMRRVLVEHARRRNTAKRGGNHQIGSLDGDRAASRDLDDYLDQVTRREDFEALDAGLCELQHMNPRQHEVFSLYYFAGLQVAETAEVLGVSTSCVEKNLAVAKAWLRGRLES